LLLLLLLLCFKLIKYYFQLETKNIEDINPTGARYSLEQETNQQSKKQQKQHLLDNSSDDDDDIIHSTKQNKAGKLIINIKNI